MLVWLYFVCILPHSLAFKMIRNSWADKSAGCSIGRLNDYRLVSFGKASTHFGYFIPIDSSGARGDIDENIYTLHTGGIQGYALQHGIPCSIHNNTMLLYAQSISSTVYIDVVLEFDDDSVKYGTIQVDVGGNFTTDATITKTDIWFNSG
eukprot:360099_1